MNPVTTAAGEIKGVDRAARGRTLTLVMLALSYTLSYFDRMLMVVLGETIKGDFQLSDKQLSILTGAAFVLIYGVVGIGAGWLLDRASRKRILVAALSLWSVATMSCGMAGNFVQLALARAAVGVGEAANVPAALAMIGDLYPPRKRPMAAAVFYIGGMLGVLLTFVFGAWMATAFSWRTAFLAAGPPGFLLAFAILFLVREPLRENEDEADSASVRPRSFQLFWRNRALLVTVFAGAMSSFGTIGMLQWLPMFFIRSHDLGMKEIGLYFGPVLAAGMAVGMIGGGVMGGWAAKRSVASLAAVCGWLAVVTAPLFLVLLWIPSAPAALGLLFFTMALSSIFSPIYTSCWQAVCAPRARGTTAGISGFLGAVIAGALCPFAVGALSDALAPSLGQESLRYALMASLTFLLAGAVLFGLSARLIARREARGTEALPA